LDGRQSRGAVRQARPPGRARAPDAGRKMPMATGRHQARAGPIAAGPGAPAIAAVGTSLVVHEWTESGPSWLHIHRSDDEAWHVLEGSLRFRFADREVDAPAGTTVFVPAGTPHTYRVTSEPSRYLIFLTPRL